MKLNTKRLSLAASAACVAALTFAAGSVYADNYGDRSRQGGDKNIVETAKAAGQFNTLAAALQQAELVEGLQGEGPFTVLAPTDEAFEALPTGTLDVLLEEANRAQLQQILLYHVIEGKVKAEDIKDQSEAETLNGEAVRISANGEEVMINETTRVIKTDVEASNGVIHVIDGVLIPTGGNAADRDTPRQPGMGTEPGMGTQPGGMGTEPGRQGGVGGGM